MGATPVYWLTIHSHGSSTGVPGNSRWLASMDVSFSPLDHSKLFPVGALEVKNLLVSLDERNLFRVR